MVQSGTPFLLVCLLVFTTVYGCVALIQRFNLLPVGDRVSWTKVKKS